MHVDEVLCHWEQRWARYSKKVSYYKILLLAKISILLQDTVSHKKKYFIT